MGLVTLLPSLWVCDVGIGVEGHQIETQPPAKIQTRGCRLVHVGRSGQGIRGEPRKSV